MEIIGFIIANTLLFFAIYGFVLVVSGSFHKVAAKKRTFLPSIKVLLPAYKPDDIFLKVLESIKNAKKNHPIEVFILFQHADESIVRASEKYGFPHVCKNFDHLDGNSYRHALQYLCKYHLDATKNRYTVIFDKDNLVDEQFFDRLANISLSEYHLIQGARKPLKTSEGIQLFDAISERYNDLMLRRGKIQLGGSLEVSGSAAIIRTNLFKYAIKRLDNKAPGYDKNFMVKLLTSPSKLKTLFVDHLIVYEEKTAKIENYRSQRLRWFGEQYFNAYFNFKLLMYSAFVKGKFRSLDYWITLVRPPRSLQLVFSLLLVPIDLINGSLSVLSLPFLFNFLSFGVIALPLMNTTNLKQLTTGALKIVYGNLITSATCLKEKYQNTFIHTR